MIDQQKKSQYWKHFTDESNKIFRPKKITEIRLKQVKEIVLGDDFLWREVLSSRHALDNTPIELKEISPSDYQQARANFWAIVRGKIHRQLAQSTG